MPRITHEHIARLHRGLSLAIQRTYHDTFSLSASGSLRARALFCTLINGIETQRESSDTFTLVAPDYLMEKLVREIPWTGTVLQVLDDEGVKPYVFKDMGRALPFENAFPYSTDVLTLRVRADFDKYPFEESSFSNFDDGVSGVYPAMDTWLLDGDAFRLQITVRCGRYKTEMDIGGFATDLSTPIRASWSSGGATGAKDASDHTALAKVTSALLIEAERLRECELTGALARERSTQKADARGDV